MIRVGESEARPWGASDSPGPNATVAHSRSAYVPISDHKRPLAEGKLIRRAANIWEAIARRNSGFKLEFVVCGQRK